MSYSGQIQSKVLAISDFITPLVPSLPVTAMCDAFVVLTKSLLVSYHGKHIKGDAEDNTPAFEALVVEIRPGTTFEYVLVSK